jgi:hypothetical protein
MVPYKESARSQQGTGKNGQQNLSGKNLPRVEAPGCEPGGAACLLLDAGRLQASPGNDGRLPKNSFCAFGSLRTAPSVAAEPAPLAAFAAVVPEVVKTPVVETPKQATNCDLCPFPFGGLFVPRASAVEFGSVW